MCGIAGILSTQAHALDFGAPLNAMQSALRHRGPDDAGLWQSPSGHAGFAHTRLSILDLSAAGHQPMSSADGRFTITFNGEIYNFLELRASLEQQGVSFRTRTDTEVILRLHERHGADALAKLRGMFAVAIWDELERSCLLARDRFGIKPLYYAATPDGMVFASEMRALLAGGRVERRTDPTALARYFTTGSVPEPLTLVQGARMLEAGCAIHWKDGAAQQRRWWRMSFPGDRKATVQEAAALTRAALLDSVEHHFISDVPVGIFLSGGVDSTALLALAHATGRRNIRTFSIGVDDASRDESALARRTAEHFGTRHTELRLDAAKGRSLFTKFLDAVDQPTIDGFNTHTVAALASEHGMKVVLSGLGGDELFAGYPSFVKLPKLVKLSRMLGPLRGLVGCVLETLGSRPQLGRLGSALRDGGTMEHLYDAFRGVFSGAEARKLAEWMGMPNAECRMQKAKRGALEHDEVEHEQEQEDEQEGMADAVSAMELSRYMRNQLLRDSDVMSMAHGLELRVPLVDSGLFETVSKLPAALRLRPGKQLLLDAVPEIPHWIRNRPKSGFLFPFEQWLATAEWQAMFDDALRDLPVQTTSWYQRWAVFVFRQWQCSSRVPSRV